MNEFYKGISFYGMNAIIRQSTGFPHLLPLPVSINPHPYWRGRDYNQYHRSWEDRYRDIFRFPGSDWLSQKAVVDNELGAQYLLEPAEMRRLLWRLTCHPKFLRQLSKQGIGRLKQSRIGQQLPRLRRKWWDAFPLSSKNVEKSG